MFLEFAAVKIANEYTDTKALEQTKQLEGQQKQTIMTTVFFAVVPLAIVNLSLLAFILVKHFNCFNSNKKLIEDTTSTTADAEASDVSQGIQLNIGGFHQNIRHPSGDVQSTTQFTNRCDEVQPGRS